MSSLITIAFVQQYKANVTLLYQQKGSKLRGLTQIEQVVGKQAFFDRLGATAAVKKVTRHGDTPLVNSPHSRRMAVMEDYEWADLVDKQDKVRTLISIESPYAVNAGHAMGRAIDDEIILAFDADAKSGETGSDTVTFASEKAGDEDFSANAITTANVLTIKKDLDDKEVDASERFLVTSPSGLEQLLKQATLPHVSSSDYNTIKALVSGDIDTWVGFKWIMSTLLPSPASNMRYGYAWHRNSMGLAMGMELITRITERSDKSYSTQVYVAGTFGGVRVQGEGVVRFKIDETK